MLTSRRAQFITAVILPAWGQRAAVRAARNLQSRGVVRSGSNTGRVEPRVRHGLTEFATRRRFAELVARLGTLMLRRGWASSCAGVHQSMCWRAVSPASRRRRRRELTELTRSPRHFLGLGACAPMREQIRIGRADQYLPAGRRSSDASSSGMIATCGVHGLLAKGAWDLVDEAIRSRDSISVLQRRCGSRSCGLFGMWCFSFGPADLLETVPVVLSGPRAAKPKRGCTRGPIQEESTSAEAPGLAIRRDWCTQ